MITGAPGSGKTMIAQQLTVKLWDVNKCHPFRVTKPSEYSKNCNSEIPQVFHIDDVFGSSNFVQARYDAWVSVFGNMRGDLRSKNTFIIFTSRDNILNANLTDLKNYDVLRHVINVSDEKFQLTGQIKRDIFENHARATQLGLKYEDIVDISQLNDDTGQTVVDPMGYPQRVRLLCLMQDVSKESKIRYFRHPMEFLVSIIGSYREKDHLSYCILILLLMKDGKLPVTFLEFSKKISFHVQRCMNICRLPTSTTMGDLRATAENLCGSFLNLDNDCFIYQHESIMEAVTLDFGKYYPSDILNRCSLQFLLERVFTKDTAPPDNEYIVIMQPVMFLQLHKRLLEEIKGSVGRGDPAALRSLSTYRVFRDSAFLLVFLRRLQQTNLFNLLLTSSSPDSQHPTLIFFAASLGQDMLIQDVLTSYLGDVQRLPGFRDHLDVILYAACNNGSLAIIRPLLSAGAQADYREAYPPDHVRLGYNWWTDKQTSTTLMHAAYSGNIEVLQAICDHLQQQQVDVVEYLKIRDHTNWGDMALHWCALGGQGADTIRILLEIGADVDAKNMLLFTALSISARIGRDAAVRVLLHATADLNTVDCEGKTALHKSTECLHATTAKLLLDAGADVNVRDGEGHTPLHYVAETNDAVIAELLLRAGADVNQRVSSSWFSRKSYSEATPLEVAFLNEHTDVVNCLRSYLSE